MTLCDIRGCRSLGMILHSSHWHIRGMHICSRLLYESVMLQLADVYVLHDVSPAAQQAAITHE